MNLKRMPCQSAINIPFDTISRLTYKPHTQEKINELNAKDFNLEKNFVKFRIYEISIVFYFFN